ncbi:ATP-binding protein [Micromonospora sp. C31]|uniref:ATP-binding protein n=1 Tax=Micromonospora sp. C31 TaxID=2824876 RepID=UPI001B396C35|nr:ATP-binding protein [Micromonospora sp. C31]MBQ1076694.1 ATP-binding protein [Micromonospora sp. C31]
MDLVARLLNTLANQPVHPAEFERCACALLQPRYPGLSAVEGGHDFGRDADIYFPFGSGDTCSRGRLLVTTGDPAANLRTGLRRMREEGLSVALVVIACIRAVSARERATLDDICAEYDLDPPHVYARDWLVAALVRDPVWRQRLLGIAGELGALVDRPLEMLEQATVSVALVGRDIELSMLRNVIADGKDAVVSGVPGVGKTRVLAELDRSVVFLEQAEPGRVIDHLLLRSPSAVVIDDAHTRVDELRVLRRARLQEGLSYSIIASTWPTMFDAVGEELPGAETVPIELLELADMNSLVESVGVTAYRARQIVLRQAEGRPGWALALCELFAKGAGYDVVSGVAHLANVERFLRRATESEIALDALACMAALGHIPVEMLHKLAPLLGVPPAELVGLMNRLSRNGLVDQAGGGWSVQASLRAPLVARWFFTDPPGRPWSTLHAAFPDRSLNLAGAVVAAAHTGSAAARSAAETWVTSLPESASWDTAIFRVVSEYSTLDESAALCAVKHARTALAAPRETVRIGEVSLDPVGDAAATLLTRAARGWLLPEAVAGLLDLAVGDNRLRHQTPAHPLRVLGDLARHVDPDYGTAVEIRERLLDGALGWLTENAEPHRWTVAAELLAAVFSVEASGSWTELGAPYTITVSQGIENARHLARLRAMWERVAEAVSADQKSELPRCPPEALRSLLDLAGEWLRLGMGFSFGQTEPTDKQKQIAADGGREILESLRPALQRVPGLALRAQRLVFDLEQRGQTTGDLIQAFELDSDLEDLVGRHDPYLADDLEAALQERGAATDALARRLAALGPALGTARFIGLLQQEGLAVEHPSGGWIAERIKQHMGDPAAWYHAAAAAGEPSLLRAATERCLAENPDTLPEAAIAGALRDSKLRPAVISAMLARSEVDDLAELVIGDLRAEDAPMLRRLFTRDAPDDVLHQLLLHPIPAIAGATAMSFGVGQKHGPALPEQWRPEWEEAIRHLRAEDLDTHGKWRTGELLKHLAEHEPDLFEAWFERQFDEADEKRFISAPEPRGCERLLGKLPQPHRERLARRCAGRPWIGKSLLTYLVGRDQELAERLLDDRTVTLDGLLEVVLGERNQTLEEIGPLLLERGVAPQRIAATAGGLVSGWGPESAKHQEIFEYFSGLGERVPALAPVGEAGCIQQATLRERAEARERQERVRGW